MSKKIREPEITEEPDKVEGRSTEVQEIFERTPGWILRYGAIVVAGLITFVLVGSIVIKYPDILSTRISITTRQPPINIVSRSGGRLHFSAKDGQSVKQDEILGYVEGASEADDVFRLSEETKKLQVQLFGGESVDANDLMLSREYQLGDLQSNYLQLLWDIRNFQRDKQLQPHQSQITALQRRIDQYKILNEQLTEQRNTQDEEFKFVEKKFKMDERLYQEKVIAEAEFNASNVNYLQVKRSIQISSNNVINNRISIGELESRIAELSIVHTEDQDKLIEAIRASFKRLESQLIAWRQQYLLIAPSDGRVSIFRFYTEDQYVVPGVDILAIVPETQNIYGQVQLPVDGSGKVEIGQRVVIRLDNFPSREYGTIVGTVESISSLPKDNQYTISIKLPEGLRTTYRNVLPFRQQLSGSAEIVTRDLSLFQRVFYSVRSLVDRARV